MHRVNKRGQDLSIGTLILIVLGIVVLVLLILGFSLGWQDLFSKINIFSGGSNLESVIQACSLSATSQAQASYCSDFKRVKIDDANEYINCQDPRVVAGLNGNTLTCSGDPAQKRCEDQVAALPGAQGEKDCSKLLKVNGQDCLATYSGLRTSCKP